MTEDPLHRSYEPGVTRRTFVTLAPLVELWRVIVGDLLELHAKAGMVPGDSITVATDPVAHDAAGLELCTESLTDEGRGPLAQPVIDEVGPCFERAQELGVGIGDISAIEVAELKVA